MDRLQDGGLQEDGYQMMDTIRRPMGPAGEDSAAFIGNLLRLADIEMLKRIKYARVMTARKPALRCGCRTGLDRRKLRVAKPFT